MDFHGLNRKKLQELCKKHGIPANLKNVEMADRLSSLLLKEEVPEKVAVKRGRSCLKNVSEDVEVVECEKVDLGSKEVKKVRFSPENQTFLFERTDPRAVRLLARKKRAFVNSRKKQDPVVVSVNFEESERLGVVSENVGRMAEPVGKRNLRRKSVVISEDVGLDLAVKGGNLGWSLRSRRGEMITETHDSVEVMSKEENAVKGRNLRRSSRRSLVEARDSGLESENVGHLEKLPTKEGNRRGEVILETHESVEMMSKEEIVVKGRNLRRSSRRSLVEAKVLGLESETVDDVEKLPTKEANLGLNLRSRRSKMKKDDVEVVSLLSPCGADFINKPETVDHVEKLPTKEDNLEINLRSRRGKMKQDNVEIVSLLSPCGGVGGDNVNKPVEGRNPKRTFRSRGGIEKENGVGGTSLLSPCVVKKAKRGTKGKGIAEEGGGEEVDKPQNEMVNHGGYIGRVTRKQLRNVDVVAVNSERDDDCVAEVSGLNNIKKRGRPRKSVRLAELSHEMIPEPLENKGSKRGRRKTLMVKQPDINEGSDVVVEKLGEGNNMDGNGSRESAKKSRKDVKDSSVEELGDIRRSSRRAAKTKVDISGSHQTTHHDERMVHMIEDDSPMPAHLEDRNPEVNEQYKATDEVSVQVPINDETTPSLLQNNGDDEANKGHECPDLVVATEEVTVQIPINNVSGDRTGGSAKRSRSNNKSGGVEGLDHTRRSGRRAAKNTVDISWSPQTMHYGEHIDHMIEDDSQMVAQHDSRSPEVNEQYPATEAVDVQMPINDDSTTSLLRNRDDDDETNNLDKCPELVVVADYNSLEENASFSPMTAQICDTTETNHTDEEQPTSLSNELESGMVASETLDSNAIPQLYGPSNEEKWPEKSPSPSKKDETDFQDINEKPDALETDFQDINEKPDALETDIVAEDSTPAANASDYRNPNTEEQYQATEAVNVLMPVDDGSTTALLQYKGDDEASKAQHCPELVVATDYDSEDKNASFCSMTAQICDATEANHCGEEQTTRSSNELESGMVASETLESSLVLELYGPSNEEKWPEKSSSPSKKDKATFEDVNGKPDVIETDLIASKYVIPGDSTPAGNASDYRNPNTEGHTHENKSPVPEKQKVEKLGDAQHNPMQLEVCKTTEINLQDVGCSSDHSTSSLVHNDCKGASNQAQEIPFRLNGAFNGSFENKNASIALDAFEGTINDTPFSPVAAENCVGTTEPLCRSAIQSTLLRSRESVSVHEDTNIMRNCEDFESNGVPELHGYEVNEQRKDEEEFEELSSPCKDNVMGSELLEDSAIFVDNLDVHEYEVIEQRKEEEQFEESSSPCKDNAVGSELLEDSAMFVDNFDVQLTEPSKVCGTTGACKSIFVHEPPSSSQSDTCIMRKSEESESNGVPELLDYEMNEQSRQGEGFEELSTQCKDITMGSERLEVSEIIVDKSDVQLTEQSKVFGSTGACNSICVHEEQPSSSRSTINKMKSSEDFESNGVSELHDYEMINQSTEGDVFEEFSSSCRDNAIGSELLEVSAIIVDNLDVHLTEQSKVSVSTNACYSICVHDEQPSSSRNDANIKRNTEDFETNGVTELNDYETNEQEEDEGVEELSSPCKDNAIGSELLEVSAVIVDKFDVQLTEESIVSGSTERNGATRDNYSGEQKAECFSDAIAFSSRSPEQLYVIDNAMQLVDYSNGESGLKEAPENAEPRVQTLANAAAAAAAVSVYQSTGHVGAGYIFQKDKFIPSPCNSKEGASLRSTEQQQLADNCKDFEYCLQHLFSEADILEAHEMKGLRALTDDGDDLKGTCSISQVTVSKVDSLLRGQVTDDIEGPSTDDMDMDDEDLKDTHSVSLTGSKTDSSLRTQVANDIDGPSTDDMDVNNNQNSVLPLNEDSETKICSTGKSTTILTTSVSMELLKEANIEEATPIPPSTLPLHMAYNRNESEMNSLTLTNHGGSNPSLIQMTDSCTEVQEDNVSTPPIIAHGTLNDNFESNEGLAKSPENENEISYNMAGGSSVGLTEQEEAGRSRWKSDIIYKQCDDSEWPAEFIADEKLEVDGEASVEGRVQSPSVMEESTPEVSPGTLQKLMEDAIDVVTVTRTRLQDGVSDGRSKKRKSESDISVQTSSSYMKTRVIGASTVFSVSMEKGKESCKESTIGDIACSKNSREVDYLNNIEKSANEDANSFVFKDHLTNFDKERDLESDKTLSVTENNDGHFVCPLDQKLNEFPNEDANNLVFEVDLMNFDKERDLESDKASRVTEGNDEGHYVSSQDKQSNESANEDANNLDFEGDLMNIDKERGLESDKTSRVTEGNDGGQYVSSQDKKSNGLQFHHCSNSSSADLSSFIMGLMEKDMGEMFQESDSNPDQEGNIVMTEAEELDARNSAMQMHQETSVASFNPMDGSITGQNQLDFSSGKDFHAICVVDVTEINEGDNLAEGLYPLSDGEKKTGKMDELFEVAPEVKSLPSSNSLREREDSNHVKGCKQVETETYMDTAALEDGSGSELCAEPGGCMTGSKMAQQIDLEEQVDYHRDPVQDDACEKSTSQLASKCPEASESLPLDVRGTSGFDDDTRDEKSFNSEACMQLKGEEDAQKVGELNAADDKMMLKRRNRNALIYGTPRKPLLPTIDMKENMAAPKRMQMVNATATKPGLKRKALGDIWK